MSDAFDGIFPKVIHGDHILGILASNRQKWGKFPLDGLIAFQPEFIKVSLSKRSRVDFPDRLVPVINFTWCLLIKSANCSVYSGLEVIF